MEHGLNDNERAKAIADLKEFSAEELTMTDAALGIAKSIREATATIAEDHREGFLDMIEEFVLDFAHAEDLDDAIAATKAEIASRTN